MPSCHWLLLRTAEVLGGCPAETLLRLLRSSRQHARRFLVHSDRVGFLALAEFSAPRAGAKFGSDDPLQSLCKTVPVQISTGALCVAVYMAQKSRQCCQSRDSCCTFGTITVGSSAYAPKACVSDESCETQLKHGKENANYPYARAEMHG